jgi:hypothetical protein
MQFNTHAFMVIHMEMEVAIVSMMLLVIIANWSHTATANVMQGSILLTSHTTEKIVAVSRLTVPWNSFVGIRGELKLDSPIVRRGCISVSSAIKLVGLGVLLTMNFRSPGVYQQLPWQSFKYL